MARALGFGNRLYPPLVGGSKNPRDFSGRGSVSRPPPPRNLLRFARKLSTLPQGEGKFPYRRFHEPLCRRRSCRGADRSGVARCRRLHARGGGGGACGGERIRSRRLRLRRPATAQVSFARRLRAPRGNGNAHRLGRRREELQQAIVRHHAQARHEPGRRRRVPQARPGGRGQDPADLQPLAAALGLANIAAASHLSVRQHRGPGMWMGLWPDTAIYIPWWIWAVTWIAAALWANRTIKRPGIAREWLYRVLALTGFVFLLGGAGKYADGHLTLGP